jgi:hypothetical protein
VEVPRFLRDQLASELQRGDAAVDVVLKMPSVVMVQHGVLLR